MIYLFNIYHLLNQAYILFDALSNTKRLKNKNVNTATLSGVSGLIHLALQKDY